MLICHEYTGLKPRHYYLVFAAAHQSFVAIVVLGRLRLRLQCCDSHLQTNCLETKIFQDIISTHCLSRRKSFKEKENVF